MAEYIHHRGVTAMNAVAVTPHDTTNFTEGACTGLYIGGDGDVVAIMAGSDNAITFAGCVAGTVLPISCTRVNSTSTTATNIVALYE